jgi:hypothetical protein
LRSPSRQRLGRVIAERNRLEKVLGEERSAEAVAARLDEFTRECELLRDTIPPDLPGSGLVVSETQRRWHSSFDHLNENIRSELRRNAPGFVGYWESNPEPIPPTPPFTPYAEGLANLSIRQLRHIAERLRQGHDSPLEPDSPGWPHLRSESRDARTAESAAKLGEDRQIGMESDVIKSTDPEGK